MQLRTVCDKRVCNFKFAPNGRSDQPACSTMTQNGSHESWELNHSDHWAN